MSHSRIALICFILLVVLGLGALVLYRQNTVDRGFTSLFDRWAAEYAGFTEVSAWRAEQTRGNKEAAELAAQREREAVVRQEKPRKEREASDLVFNACWEAMKAVKARLKAPATADFPSCGEFQVRANPARTEIFVIGYVDAQNSFGAKLRNNFVVKFTVYGGAWSVVNFAMR
jgi:hypothetical protein